MLSWGARFSGLIIGVLCFAVAGCSPVSPVAETPSGAPGMTQEQADQLILDAMSSSIYGPWILNGIAP